MGKPKLTPKKYLKKAIKGTREHEDSLASELLPTNALELAGHDASRDEPRGKRVFAWPPT
jgi:hypothetical protein